MDLGSRWQPTGPGLTTRQLLILPAVMAVLSLSGLHQSFEPSAIAACGWVAAVIVSLAVGKTLPPQDGVQYSPVTRRIRVPGSWVPLVQMMTMFFLRYVAAVSLAMHPALRTDLAFVAAIGLAYGLSSGLFAARALRTFNSAFRRDSRAIAVFSALVGVMLCVVFDRTLRGLIEWPSWPPTTPTAHVARQRFREARYDTRWESSGVT